MADIKQAARWMQEGKQVRRTLWANRNTRIGLCGAGLVDLFWVTHSGEEIHEEFRLMPNDLLVDDWEVFEEASHA